MKNKIENWDFSNSQGKLIIKKDLNSNHYSNQRNEFNFYFYESFKYMFVTFFDITTAQITGSGESNIGSMIQFNYCLNGRVELDLEDGLNICLKAGDFCLSKEVSKSPSYFPTNEYQGISIYFDRNLFFKENKALLEYFELDFIKLEKIFFQDCSTIISKADDVLKLVMNSLWENRQDLDNYTLKHQSIEIINQLLNFNLLKEKNEPYYTRLQAKIAKQAHEIMINNLDQRIPIKDLAQGFGISETSLKNYFKAVYGQNISSYLKNYRIKKAAKLLLETKYSVGEISLMVGYSKQGKFAELFKKQFNHSPLVYRRIHFFNDK